MATTTGGAIRDRIIALVKALAPTVDSSVAFRPYENQGGANFRKFCRGAPMGSERLYQVRDVTTRQPADASNTDVEARMVTFDVIVAYPQTHQWGVDAGLDRDDAMDADRKLIENAIGRNGYGNFANDYPNASWIGESAAGSQTATTFERTDDDPVDFLVIRQTMRYYQANTAQSPTPPPPTWTVDAMSGMGVPVDATEWAAVLAAAGIASGGPSALTLCQEAAGNLADSIGAFTLAFAGAGRTYQNAVAGWTRKSVGIPDANNTAIWSNTDPALPDLSTTSHLRICYALVGAPASTRNMWLNGTATVCAMQITATPRLTVIDGANTATSTTDPTGAVRPFVQRHDKTNARAGGFTDVDKVLPAIGAATGKKLTLGVGSNVNGPYQFLYCADFFGAAAELTDAQIKTLLQTLGWTVAWS